MIPSINLDGSLTSALQRLAVLGSATRHKDENLGIFHHIRLFQNFVCAEVVQLSRKMKYFPFKRGDVLMKDDEDGDFLGIVLTRKTGRSTLGTRYCGSSCKLLRNTCVKPATGCSRSSAAQRLE